MKFKFKEQTKENILTLTCSGILLLSFYFLITNFPQLKQLLGDILGNSASVYPGIFAGIFVSSGNGSGRKKVVSEIKNEAVGKT